MTSRSWSEWDSCWVSVYIIDVNVSLFYHHQFAGLDKGECTAENIERVKAWVPPNLAKYVEGLYLYKKSGRFMYDSLLLL